MPFRYFIRLSYKGTRYHGWQVQPGAVTIQEVLNQQLSILLREKIYLVGAGRTDTGVHALCYYAHFDSNQENLHINKEKIIYHLNCLLPCDIAVHDIFNCCIEKAYWEIAGDEIHFYISADRFLRNMVRAIVGTCLGVGEHKITLAQFRQIIENKDRSSAGVSVAAKGLHLIDIIYSGSIFD